MSKVIRRSRSSELVPADGPRLRREALESLAEVSSLLSEVQGQLIEFADRDQPAFSLWIETEFGPELSELRALYRELALRRDRIQAAGREAQARGIGFKQAYERVQKREKSRRPGPEPDEGAGSGPGDRPGPEDRAAPEAERVARPKLDAGEAGQLRKLYRMLARALHPDASTGEVARSPRASALWLEVQRAYEARDVAMLAALWERTRGGETKEAAPREENPGLLTLGDIFERIQQLLETMRLAERDLSRAKRERAWGFGREGKLRARKLRELGPKIRRELEEEREEDLAALDELEDVLEDLAASREGTGGRSRRRGRGRARR